ncbi:uncharacterized protein [Rutidosis leptorrhynchoides]|uniref:uncharacterized protein isoform X2 n=1 Tax=Rutidosis leptorrhynchoides TaxID=125765 RepID=UPI003A99A2B0
MIDTTLVYLFPVIPTMITLLNLHRVSYPNVNFNNSQQLSGNAVALRHSNFRRLSLHNRSLISLSTNSTNTSSFQPSVDSSSISSTLNSSVGSPSSSVPTLSQWNLNQRHVTVLNFIACTTAISAALLFFSAIPTLLAFKRAAESLEKLLDVTREELPDTMAAVRLSGMEISDLTMELSDLGQDITRGVKSSTRAVRLAEERLRRLTNMNSSGGGPIETRRSRASGC